MAGKPVRGAQMFAFPAFLYSLACLLIGEHATIISRIIAINIIIISIRIFSVRSIRTKSIAIFSSNLSLSFTAFRDYLV